MLYNGHMISDKERTATTPDEGGTIKPPDLIPPAQPHARLESLAQTQAEKSEKQRRWDEIAAEVDQITDRLGKPIDPGIRETVIGLMASGFDTEQSCEGHLDHGIPAPWVDIGVKVPDDVAQAEKEAFAAMRATDEQQTDKETIYQLQRRIRETVKESDKYLH